MNTYVVLGPEEHIRRFLDVIAGVTKLWRIVNRPRKFASTQVCSVVIEMSKDLADELRSIVSGVTISVQEYAYLA
jgi:hypothetical protein